MNEDKIKQIFSQHNFFIGVRQVGTDITSRTYAISFRSALPDEKYLPFSLIPVLIEDAGLKIRSIECNNCFIFYTDYVFDEEDN